MKVLYHVALSPFCRKIRLALSEKKLPFELRAERVWERREAFLALNPACDVPVFVDDDNIVLADSTSIAEYLEETYPEIPLHGSDPIERAEVRRLVAWFDRKFDTEVTENLVGEKVFKRLKRSGGPDSLTIRAGLMNIGTHLAYISFLAERRNWLAGERMTLADLAAAAHLSSVDYLGDVPWDDYAEAKDWYARIKSRPSFRALLQDQIPGLPPAPIYTNLDF
ncbi:MAG: glutathione S-transferase family protein [Hyphomicrobiales bacterium]|nr:glutathione S-transferase family protein [Hyphomicrobiales bacterium]